MAPTYSFWKSMLLAMAVAAVVSASAASLAEEDEAPGRGRFLASFDDAAPAGIIHGRRHLNAFDLNLCGPGSSDECVKIWGKFWNKPMCCKDILGISKCFDVGNNLFDKCGSCDNKCSFGQICCNGKCANLASDPNNCGRCGKVCPRGVPCTRFTCGYNGKN